ncbi:hypothetical protein BH23CHL7_BH23CHL7_20360 [soil metagenome]
MAGDEFELRSPEGRVRLVRSGKCPDPKGYFLFIGEELVGRSSTLNRGRDNFRALAAIHDPPRPVDEPVSPEGSRLLTEEEVARFFAERAQQRAAPKGGRVRRR